LLHLLLSEISSCFWYSLFMVLFFLHFSPKLPYFPNIALNDIILFQCWFNVTKQSIKLFIIFIFNNFFVFSFLSNFIFNLDLDWNSFVWVKCQINKLMKKLSFLASWPHLEFWRFCEFVGMIRDRRHWICKRSPNFQVLLWVLCILKKELCRSCLLFAWYFDIDLCLLNNLNLKSVSLV